MKTVLPFILLLFQAILPARGQGHWEIINEGIAHDFQSVDFINNDAGWFSGEQGLFRTVDGAENWTLASKSVHHVFDFHNDSIGWALIDINWIEHICKTVDGGLNWIQQKRNDDDIWNLSAMTDSIVYASGYQVFKTSDGGSSWNNITPISGLEFRFDQYFRDADTGVIVADTGMLICPDIFFKTFDGGAQWDTISTGLDNIRDVIFADGSTAYFIADDDSIENYSRGIYRTDDAFESWTRIADDTSSIQQLSHVGGDTILAFGFGEILISTDGGSTWTGTDHMVLGPPEWNPYHLVVTSDVVYFFYAVPFGNESGMSQLLKSTDQGLSWSRVSFTFPLNDVHFINRETGFISGGQDGVHSVAGFLLAIRDGGQQWETVPVPSNTVYHNVHFLNDSTGYTSADWNWNNRWSSHRTTDGGKTWQLTDDPYCIDYCNADDTLSWRIAVDDSLRIQKTVDGGLSWAAMYSLHRNAPPYYELNSIFAKCADTVYCVGEEGVILKISDQEAREIESGTTLPLNNVLFIDNRYGFITGGYTSEEDYMPVMIYSSDGGDHWEEVANWPYLIHDMHFMNGYHGFAAGEDSTGSGVLLETTDRGQTWTEVPLGDSVHGPIRALHFKDGIGWAVGDHSLIIRTKDTVKSSVDRFMVVADFHHYSPSGDLTGDLLYEMAQAAIGEGVDFVFFPGDLIIRPFSTPEEEESFLRDWRTVLSTLAYNDIRVYACRGNNDIGSREAWDALFSGQWAFPRNGPETEKNITYAIGYDNLLFIALDQYEDARKINQEWLDGVLDTTNRELIFVAGHEPAFKLFHAGMGASPGERNLFWESLEDAGVKAFFCGHDHFYDHAVIDNGDGHPENDVHQVIVGTGGGSFHADAEYDGDNGRWTPVRLFHEQEHGYVLVEIDSLDVKMTWKHRTGPGVFEFGGDSLTFPRWTTGWKQDPRDPDRLTGYPNPFDARTTIRYRVQKPGRVELSIYDLFGRRVAALVDETRSAGRHEEVWTSGGMRPGIYFCELKTGQERQVLKMILTR